MSERLGLTNWLTGRLGVLLAVKSSSSPPDSQKIWRALTDRNRSCWLFSGLLMRGTVFGKGGRSTLTSPVSSLTFITLQSTGAWLFSPPCRQEGQGRRIR